MTQNGHLTLVAAGLPANTGRRNCLLLQSYTAAPSARGGTRGCPPFKFVSVPVWHRALPLPSAQDASMEGGASSIARRLGAHATGREHFWGTTWTCDMMQRVGCTRVTTPSAARRLSGEECGRHTPGPPRRTSLPNISRVVGKGRQGAFCRHYENLLLLAWQ